MVSYFKKTFFAPADAKLNDLTPVNLIAFSIISNLLVPTDGHRTDANKMELYLFYCFREKIRIDFGFVMCKFLLRYATDSRRKLSYGKFLQKVFEFYKVPILGVCPKETSSSTFTKAYFE